MVSNQPKYSMFHRIVETDGTQEYCFKNGIGMILYSPLDQGILTDKYRNLKIPVGSRVTERAHLQVEIKKDYYQKPLTELYQLADELNVPLSSLALQWLFQQKAVTSAIIGAKTPDQVTENIKCMELKLTPEVLAKIDTILLKRKAYILKEDSDEILKKCRV